MNMLTQVYLGKATFTKQANDAIVSKILSLHSQPSLLPPKIASGFIIIIADVSVCEGSLILFAPYKSLTVPGDDGTYLFQVGKLETRGHGLLCIHHYDCRDSTARAVGGNIYEPTCALCRKVSGEIHHYQDVIGVQRPHQRVCILPASGTAPVDTSESLFPMCSVRSTNC